MRNVLVGLVVIAALATGLALRPGRPADPADQSADAQALAAQAPAAELLTKIPIDARLGRDGIRVSPNGELIEVLRITDPPATPTEISIYDLSGKRLARATDLTVYNSAWLSDSSGIALMTDRSGTSEDLRFDIRVLGVDGTLRTAARSVRDTTRRDLRVSPAGDLLLQRGSQLIAVRADGSGESVVASGDVRALGWDDQSRALYVALPSAEVVTADRDGAVVRRSSLRLPSGIVALDAWFGASIDGRAGVVGLRTDRAFEGSQNPYGARFIVDGAVRDPRPRSVYFDMPLGPHEVVAMDGQQAVRYDLVTGASAPLGPMPMAISGDVLLATMSVNGGPRIRVAHAGDVAWRELDLPFDVMPASAISRRLSNGKFLIFDKDGALWSLDGQVALARSSAALTECRDTTPGPPDGRKPIPAATAEQVRAGIGWDPAFRHMVEDVTGSRQGSNPLRDPAVPRCRVDLLEIGVPVYVMRTASTGTWYVPVIFAGRTILQARVGTTSGNGTFVGTVGGPWNVIEEARARRLGGTATDAVTSARLRYVVAGGRGPELIAWELTRASGTVVYLVSAYPGADADGRLFEAREVELPR